jgi:hypothetical protein
MPAARNKFRANDGDPPLDVGYQRVAFPQKHAAALRPLKSNSAGEHFRFRVLRGVYKMSVRLIHDDSALVW